jgi:galactose oxidase
MNYLNIALFVSLLALSACGGATNTTTPKTNPPTAPNPTDTPKKPEPKDPTKNQNPEKPPTAPVPKTPKLPKTPDAAINKSQSKWDGPYKMPLVASAAANLPDGRILTWSAYAKLKFHYGDVGIGKTYTSIFDPKTNRSNDGLVSNTEHDMFCPGTAMLEDGRIMVTGGSSDKQTSIYDPASGDWFKGPKMNISRAYHSMTPLADGSIFTLGGSWGFDTQPGNTRPGNKNGEVWKQDIGWKNKPNILANPLSTNDKKGLYRGDNHMWLFTAPNGLVFHAGPAKQMHWINTVGAGSTRKSIRRGNDADSMDGNAVMYDIGKILTLGGSPNYDDSDATKHAHVIDISKGIGQVTVKKVADMHHARAFNNSVVLPSGEVVVVGGQSHAVIFTDTASAYKAEIWNPKTEQFTELAAMKVPRNYHSVSLLMNDGRVFVAGGGLCGTCTTNHPDAEIFTPPYLLTVDGKPAIRPVIKSAPSIARPGDTINISVDTSGLHRFALTRMSAATHAVNNDERRIPLVIDTTDQNKGLYALKIPANTAVVIPGNYFLFALNKNGVPSLAKVINIREY